MRSWPPRRGRLVALSVRVPLLVAVTLLCLSGGAGCRNRSSRSAPAVTINEVMAGGDQPLRNADGTLLVDAEGEPADWVEIYNPLPTAVNLAGFTLTDNPQNRDKYRFPPVVLGPGEFVVVILDGQPEAGPLHADFGLRASGEEVILYGRDGRVEVDRRVFRELEPGVTAGRYPDGNEDYGVIYGPTPGRKNKRIGIKPPRIRTAPQVVAESSAGGEDLSLVEVTVLEDTGVEITRATLERALAEICEGAYEEDPQSPAAIAEVFSRIEGPSEVRRDAYGVDLPEPQPQELITFVAYVPKEEEDTLIRLRSIAENEIGEAVRLGCHVFGEDRPPVVINEFQGSNVATILFDKQRGDGAPTERGLSLDWLELYNYGEVSVDLSNFALVSGGVYDALNSPTPPPDLFVWTFKDVGIGSIQPGQHLLLVADDDNPTVDGYNTYSRAGSTDYRYRSVMFAIERNQADSFHLLDERRNLVDAALFDFTDPDTGDSVATDRSFGRYPDGSQPEFRLQYGPGPNGPIEIGGRLFDCPTPEERNKLDCDVVPRFDEVVFTEPRCPGPGLKTTITAFVGIDVRTAEADTPQSPTFELEFIYQAGGQETVQARGAIKAVHPATLSEINAYRPQPIPGAILYFVQAEVPGQPPETLVVFRFRARDLYLPVARQKPELGVWVEHGEKPRDEPGGQVSFRFKSGYQRPPLVLNEVYPASIPGGPPLRYGGRREGQDIANLDFVEIYNPSDVELDLSGMYLHDEDQPASTYPQGRILESQIPAGSRVGPHGFLCLFFPRPGEEQAVPPDALPVTNLGLDDCSEVLYLLAPDADGHCVVAEVQWNINTAPPGRPRDCPPGVAVGLFPDGEETPGLNMDRLPFPTPCASNCGERPPEFLREPYHAPLISPNDIQACVEPGSLVLVRAEVLIDTFAAVLFPAPVQGRATGIREAWLVIRKGARVTEERMNVSHLNDPPDDCWLRLRLEGQVRPPQPQVVFYSVRVVDGYGATLESAEFSFGVTEGKPLMAINEVMAVNTRTLQDETGAYPPWIELFNGDSVAVDLGGMFLTDDLVVPRKWQVPRIPQALLPPQGCLVVYADFDPLEPNDDLHASLTLQTSGEGRLFLLDRPESGTCVIDRFTYDFTNLPADTSIGRTPDVTGEPQRLETPTPCGSNSGGVFVRGDINSSGHVNITDVVGIYQVLFNNMPRPPCQKVLDADDDGDFDEQDGLFLSQALYLRGTPIPAPYPAPGTDPTPDALPCR